MKEITNSTYATSLVDLLEALKATGRTFPEPVCKYHYSGWQLIIMADGQGMSLVHHDHSYDLETAQITGTPDDWSFTDSDACTQVKGYREPADVAAELVDVLFPKMLN
jgi:hypothetical protein